MLEALWLAEDAASATGGALAGADSWIASGVSIDTRTLQKGDLFVALKDVRDGHDFVADAFAKGAVAALISDPRALGQGPTLLTHDVLDGLTRLAEVARDRSAAKRVAITGSVGKTSVKEATLLALSATARTHASVKSYNNHWGVPLTLARMPSEARFGVFECGMNHRHEIEPLSRLVRPHVAVVTWIAPAHIENLGSLEQIATEKADLFQGLELGGVALLPAEAPHADILMEAAKRWAGQVIRFGREASCEARLLSYEPTEGGARATADILGNLISYRVGAEGAHWALNSLAAITAAHAAGGDLQAAAIAMEDLRPLDGRGASTLVRGPFGAITVIDDAYNANPASMAMALESMAARTPGPGGRRIAVLGDMLELGPDAAAYHAGLAPAVAKGRLDLAFCAGPMCAELFAALPTARQGAQAPTSTEIIEPLISVLRDGDIVLIKGSNGSQMGRVVDALKRFGSV
jgi:UDP-N-acetylmuramoyl-tripeptide--D-alanyl-D-alanine ligase